MTDIADSMVELKNNWLYKQVEVAFPTHESLLGRTIYQNKQIGRVSEPWSPLASVVSKTDDIYLADFHRLTIGFALLQAEQYSDASEKNHIIEFLTQIIYSKPCELYLGFEKGVAVACAVVTRNNTDVLISDVVVKDQCQFVECDVFASMLIAKLEGEIKNMQFYIQR
jgi:hypothetical protein